MPPSDGVQVADGLSPIPIKRVVVYMEAKRKGSALSQTAYASYDGSSEEKARFTAQLVMIELYNLYVVGLGQPDERFRPVAAKKMNRSIAEVIRRQKSVQYDHCTSNGRLKVSISLDEDRL